MSRYKPTNLQPFPENYRHCSTADCWYFQHGVAHVGPCYLNGKGQHDEIPDRSPNTHQRG